MTSYEFEVASKNAVKDILKKNYDITVTTQQLEIVWFAHLLGFKKCTLYSPLMGKLYAEVTYNRTGEMYVDMYKKESNTVVKEFNFKEDKEWTTGNITITTTTKEI